MSKWYDEMRIPNVDLCAPKPVDCNFRIMDKVVNQLLLACDDLERDPNDYVNHAIIEQLKRDKKWL